MLLPFNLSRICDGVMVGANRSGPGWKSNPRSMEDFRRLEQYSFTVFVDNLPSTMTKAWLGRIFKFGGKVVDIYISRKVRKTCLSDLKQRKEL